MGESIEALADALPLRPTERLIARRFAEWCTASETDSLSSQKTMSDAFGINVRTLQRYLPNLEAAGLISVRRHSGRAHVYYFHFETFADPQQIPLDARYPTVDNTSPTDAPGQLYLFGDEGRGTQTGPKRCAPVEAVTPLEHNTIHGMDNRCTSFWIRLMSWLWSLVPSPTPASDPRQPPPQPPPTPATTPANPRQTPANPRQTPANPPPNPASHENMRSYETHDHEKPRFSWQGRSVEAKHVANLPAIRELYPAAVECFELVDAPETWRGYVACCLCARDKARKTGAFLGNLLSRRAWEFRGLRGVSEKYFDKADQLLRDDERQRRNVHPDDAALVEAVAGSMTDQEPARVRPSLRDMEQHVEMLRVRRKESDG